MENVKGYTLVNAEKVERSLNGVIQSNGDVVGGVGNGAYFEEGDWKRNGELLSEDDSSVLETNLLAEYDRLGGLIRRSSDKVKTGAFYDFSGKKPRKDPKVVFVFEVNGKFVEVPDGVELPGIVKAAKSYEETEKKKVKKSRKSAE